MKRLILIFVVLFTVGCTLPAVAGEKEDLALKIFVANETLRIKVQEAKDLQKELNRLNKQLKELIKKDEAKKAKK